jgi:hypothetical protein
MKRFRQGFKAFAVSQTAHVILFLTVNIIFGALGFLSPIAIEYAATNDFYPALKKQLEAAGPYTFAIAFLASMVVYVVAEYLDKEEVAQFRSAKAMLSATAGLLIVCCAIFSGAQAARPLKGAAPAAPAAPSTAATAATAAPTAAPTAAALCAEQSGSCSPGESLELRP